MVRNVRFFYGSRKDEQISTISQFSRVQTFPAESEDGANETDTSIIVYGVILENKFFLPAGQA